MSTEFYWVAVAVVTVISSSRLTRLLTFDKFPPTLWVKEKFSDWTDKSPRRLPWQRLFYCGYCMSFWTTLLVVAVGLLCGVYDTSIPEWGTDNAFAGWWIFFGSLAASYVAAIFMAFDGDPGEDD